MLTNSRQTTLNEQLVQACIDFNIPNIEHFLNEGADPDFLTVRDFIENKHYYVPYLKSPLDIIFCKYLSISKSDSELTQVVKLLLDHGANVEGGTSGEYLSTPLHEAVDANKFALVKLLIERGADVNVPNNDGAYTPLHLACHCWVDSALVEFLIQHGAEVNNQNEYGEIPINLLVSYAPNPLYSDMNIIPHLEILIQYGGDFSITDSEQKSAWSLMQNRPDLKIATMNALLKNESNTHYELMQKISMLLPQFGIKNINELNDSANKMVSIAIIDKIIETHLLSIYPENILENKLIQAVTEFNLDKMSSLLEEGADPDFLAPSSCYPFKNATALHLLSSHYYSEFGNHKILPSMKLLLDNGASPNVVNEQGDSPLHILAKFTKGNFLFDTQLEIFNLLLKNGADLNLKNHHGHTPAEDLVEKSNFSMLKNYSNEESDLNVEPEGPQTITALIENNAEVINPFNEPKTIKVNHETVLVLEDIIQVDVQDKLFLQVQFENQEIMFTEETNLCLPYDGYTPHSVMESQNLENLCDSSGTIM